MEFGFQDNTQAIYPARSWGGAALCGLDCSQLTPVVSLLFYWQPLNHKRLGVVCGQQAFIFQMHIALHDTGPHQRDKGDLFIWWLYVLPWALHPLEKGTPTCYTAENAPEV